MAIHYYQIIFFSVSAQVYCYFLLWSCWYLIANKGLIWFLYFSKKCTSTQVSFFQSAIVSILLYGCTTWTLIKRMKKKLDGNYTIVPRAILNKSWRQHPTKQQLYGHLPPITKTILVRRTRHAEHCWRSREGLISDVLPWTPSHGRAKAERPARTYIQQLCGDMGCSHGDRLEAMNDRDGWRERVRDIRADGTRWWWHKSHFWTIPSIFLFILGPKTDSLACRLHFSCPWWPACIFSRIWPVIALELRRVPLLIYRIHIF